MMFTAVMSSTAHAHAHVVQSNWKITGVHDSTLDPYYYLRTGPPSTSGSGEDDQGWGGSVLRASRCVAGHGHRLTG
jgi:hypothetical protein